ncbi:MAG: DUF2971 domain-containing protein [Gemmatimonadaceae bacterium]
MPETTVPSERVSASGPPVAQAARAPAVAAATPAESAEKKPAPEPPPDILYHYTTRAGMLGILQNRCIWLSDATYLNDASEIAYGYQLINEAMRNAMSSTLKKGPPKRGARLTPRSVYVSSFTTEDDDLSQWRGYGGTGDAYCIGFRYTAIKAGAKSADIQLAKCIYSKDLQKQLASRSYLRLVFGETFYGKKKGRKKAAKSPGGVLGFISRLFKPLGVTKETLPLEAARIKHPAFEAEHEWRLITNAVPSGLTLKFRPSRSSLIPFFELPLKDKLWDGLVVSVRVGPSPNAAQDARAVQRLLRATGCEKATVKRSGIPFRNW